MSSEGQAIRSGKAYESADIAIIFYSIYGAVCLQLTHFSCDDRENVYFILLSSSNRKYESLTIV